MQYYGPRMSLLECQASNIRGYCAYTSPTYGLVDALIADIHDRSTRGSSQQVLRTYKSLSYGDWLYMPIDSGEHVSDIWLVRFEEGGISFMVRKLFHHILRPHTPTTRSEVNEVLGLYY